MKGDKLAKISLLLSLTPVISGLIYIIIGFSAASSSSLFSPLSLIIYLLALLSVLSPPIALILSIIVLAKKMEGKGYAIAGLIISIIEMLIFLCLLFIFIRLASVSF